MASATILLFKTDGQYAEHTGFVVDSGKGELSLVLVGRDGVRDGGTVFKASSQRSFAGWDEYVSKALSSGASCSVR